MAPSLHGKTSRVSKRQARLQSYTKVSKSISSRPNVEALLKEAALKPVVNLQTPTKATPKRKHSEVQDGSETESRRTTGGSTASKKPKLQLSTPPLSQATPAESTDEALGPPLDLDRLSLDTHASIQSASPHRLPNPLRDLISLHGAFLRAFTLHVVHNGRSAPADLNTLMASVTRLWMKHTIQKEDIQRMLAMYELDGSDKVVAGQTMKHKKSPFRLTVVGGGSLRYSVEYVGSGGIDRLLGPPLDEFQLQELYEVQLMAALASQHKDGDGWLHGELSQFPRLDFAIGVQTQARKEKAAATRKEILGLSAEAQNRGGAQFAGVKEPSQNEEVETPTTVKDRTLSLLERVRAKALASSSTTPHTPEAIVRRYALGRIQEVVEILRMLQQRKLASNFNSSIHSSPGKVRGKVSFSLSQLVNDIRMSLAVPLGEAEIRMCITILAHDVPGTWLSVYTVGNVSSVILNGPGLSGLEVKKILDGCQ